MSYKMRRRGFNLLELMIVLVIMAAATAIVWPNLQKPLRRSSLTESAGLVRELLSDARQQASTRGTACFVRFETASNQFYMGTLAQFLEDQSLIEGSSFAANSTSTQSFGSASPVLAQSRATSTSGTSSARTFSSGRITENASRPKLIKLPENVVIIEVRQSIATSRSGIATFGQSADDLYSPSSAKDELLPDEPLNRPSDLQRQPEQSKERQVIWLPVLAGDLGRDVTITLLDTQLQESIHVTFCAATGSIEILP
jgi:prepilin-type N-terminal cleavage/methylation domain-containing protein